MSFDLSLWLAALLCVREHRSATGADMTPSGRATAISDLAEAARDADGLVNTTPIGTDMYPGLPIDAEILRPDLWVADIVYYPAETELLQQARKRGCRTMSGAAMAVFQAVDAFRLFTGPNPDPQRMRRHFDADE